MQHSRDFRNKVGLEPESRPWSIKPAVALRGVPVHNPRMVDVIDVAYGMAKLALPAATERDLTAALVVDFSQSLKFKPWSRQAPCFSTSTRLYMFERDRVMVQSEVFRILGFADIDLSGLSETNLRDLSGDAMAIYSAVQVVASVALVLPFPNLFSSPRR